MYCQRWNSKSQLKLLVKLTITMQIFRLWFLKGGGKQSSSPSLFVILCILQREKKISTENSSNFLLQKRTIVSSVLFLCSPDAICFENKCIKIKVLKKGYLHAVSNYSTKYHFQSNYQLTRVCLLLWNEGIWNFRKQKQLFLSTCIIISGLQFLFLIFNWLCIYLNFFKSVD